MELFTHELRNEHIYFKHARGKTIAEGKEFHTFHEIILFLDGEGELITEEQHTPLAPNTLVIVPKETYHQVRISGNQERYYRCLFNFHDHPFSLDFASRYAGRVQVLIADREILQLFATLQQKAAFPSPGDAVLLSAVLALLVDTLPQKVQSLLPHTANSPLVNDALRLIAGQGDAPLSSEKIAKALNVSLSTLQHTFMRELHIPLYQYMLKKRLFTARQRIRAGQPATAVAADLGFHDYSGFYKQYKKIFGHSPSAEK